MVAIAPGGGNYSLARRWLPLGFARVADELVRKYEAKIVLVGSADELDLARQIQDLMEYGESATILAGQTNVAEVSAFFQHCDLFIGNDGGLMNLAAAVGTPLVAIFGPTNHRAWGPKGWQTLTDLSRVELSRAELSRAEPSPTTGGVETKKGRGGSIIVQADLDLACRPCLYRNFELGQRYGCAPRPCLTEISPEQVLQAAEKLLVDGRQ